MIGIAFIIFTVSLWFVFWAVNVKIDSRIKKEYINKYNQQKVFWEGKGIPYCIKNNYE